MFASLLGGLHFPLGYIVINLDPIAFQIGNLAIHWYGIAYVVAISIGLWALRRYVRAQGIHDDQLWSIFIWTAIAGLIGGRLYFVIQQPNLVNGYLLNPINILSVWNGGMAFFGAIFAGTATLFLLAPRYGISRFFAIDCGALFAAIGQIFGRFGNIVNGDITGQALSSFPITIPGDTCAHAPCVAYVSDPHYSPWAFVYLNSHSFAVQGIPFQPAPVFEILANLVALAILWNLRFLLPRRRAGYFFTLYLALYSVGQFAVFFFRGSEPITPFLGVVSLKQAQWTAIITLLLCVPLFLLVRRFGRPWTYSAKNPVPWTPANAPAAPAPVPAVVPVGRASFTTGAATPARSAAAKRPATAPEEDHLPPWQPTHATHGQLRNVFGPSASPPGTR
jgi:phosphatidylglycerol:prolipoprotein diacylglycerol transferase